MPFARTLRGSTSVSFKKKRTAFTGLAGTYLEITRQGVTSQTFGGGVFPVTDTSAATTIVAKGGSANVKFELWGAAGGNGRYSSGAISGAGGFYSGFVNLVQDQTYYLYLGTAGGCGGIGMLDSAGNPVNGGFNPGGYNPGGLGGTTNGVSTGGFGCAGTYGPGGGGGGLTILCNAEFVANLSPSNIMLVAGGGGGTSGYNHQATEAAGGGSSGQDSRSSTGGGQGAGGSTGGKGVTGSYLKGGEYTTQGRTTEDPAFSGSGGGGGGWYGGGFGSPGNGLLGAGGSGYANPSHVTNAIGGTGSGGTAGTGAGASTLPSGRVNGVISSTAVTISNPGYAVIKPTALAALQAPEVAIAPSITGSAVEGQPLTVSNGLWRTGEFPTFTHQWQKDNVDIFGATGLTYSANSSIVGSTVRCVVTATNSYGAANFTTASTAIITAAPTPSGTVGQQNLYTSTYPGSGGSTTFIVPSGVTSISVVCIGSGGGGGYYSGRGGGGGGLRYKNNITVTPGQSITCRTGNPNRYSDDVLNTSFGTTEDFAFYAEAGRYGGYGGTGETSGNGGGGSTITGEMGGGNGGSTTNAAGAGAGGYTGNGGNTGTPGTAGSGGGGGGGYSGQFGGGGVGLYGIGASGAAGTSGDGAGKKGSSKSGNGVPYTSSDGYGGSSPANGAHGGGGTNNDPYTAGMGGIRVIWPGNQRKFPELYTENI
jgi:hypothetical protein